MQATWTTRSEAGPHTVHVRARRAAYRCGTCGYGAVLPTPMVRSCPMCRSTGWLPDARVRLGDLDGDPT